MGGEAGGPWGAGRPKVPGVVQNPKKTENLMGFRDEKDRSGPGKCNEPAGKGD